MSGKNRLQGGVAKHANRLLPKVDALFKERGISYCLDGGTLLGVIREGRLLPWDDDLDFFVPSESAAAIKKLRLRLLFMGCKLRIRYAKQAVGPIPKGAPRIFKIVTIRRHKGHRVVIDLIVKYADDQNFHWLVGKPPVHKKVPRKYYDTYETVDYMGREYPIPSDVENYLECRYGNWRVTQKEWDFKKDDKAIAP